jgi:hypothetical protein
VKHDEFFETVAPRTGNPDLASHWQGLSGLGIRKRKPPDPDVFLNPIPDGNRLVNVYDPVERHAETRHVELRELEAEHITQASEGVTLTPDTEVGVIRPGWVRNPTRLMLESISQEQITFYASLSAEQMKCYSDEDSADESYYDAMHEDYYRIQDEIADHITFLANADDDTMYYHQLMKYPDRDEFFKAIVKEMHDHIVKKH